MKKSHIVFIILIAWLPFLIGAWDKDKPSSTTSLRSSNPEILANNAALETAIGANHEFSTGGTNSGKHTTIVMQEQASITTAANEMGLYCADLGTAPGIYVRPQSDGTAIQWSDIAGKIVNAAMADDSVDSAQYVDGSIDAAHLAADVVDETKIADNGIDSEHYNDGSIDAAHLAADVIDETKIADDGIDSEHYNDGSIDGEHVSATGLYGFFGSWTSLDSASNALAREETYRVGSDGFVQVLVTMNTTGRFYTDASATPGTMRASLSGDGSTEFLSCPVKKDDYWKYTQGSGTPLIHWLPIGTGTCVKQ